MQQQLLIKISLLHSLISLRQGIIRLCILQRQIKWSSHLQTVQISKENPSSCEELVAYNYVELHLQQVDSDFFGHMSLYDSVSSF